MVNIRKLCWTRRHAFSNPYVALCRRQWRCCVVLETHWTKKNTAVRFIHPDYPYLAAYDGLVDEDVVADGNKWDDQAGANVWHSTQENPLLVTFSKCRGRCVSQGDQCGTLLCLNMDMKVVRVYLCLWYLSCQIRCRELWIIIHLQENLKCCEVTLFFIHVGPYFKMNVAP